MAGDALCVMPLAAFSCLMQPDQQGLNTGLMLGSLLFCLELEVPRPHKHRFCCHRQGRYVNLDPTGFLASTRLPLERSVSSCVACAAAPTSRGPTLKHHSCRSMDRHQLWPLTSASSSGVLLSADAAASGEMARLEAVASSRAVALAGGQASRSWLLRVMVGWGWTRGAPMMPSRQRGRGT